MGSKQVKARFRATLEKAPDPAGRELDEHQQSDQPVQPDGDGVISALFSHVVFSLPAGTALYGWHPGFMSTLQVCKLT
jgi:hypothetical protein